MLTDIHFDEAKKNLWKKNSNWRLKKTEIFNSPPILNIFHIDVHNLIKIYLMRGQPLFWVN